METKFKVGDRVRVKSIEWYNANKYSSTNTSVNIAELGFVEAMSLYCGKVLKITTILSDYYRTDCNIFCWQDWMLEDEPVDEENQEVKQLNKNNMETKKMTLKEAQEFVKKTRYIVWSEDESRKLQEKLFEIGCKWLVTGAYLCHTEEPFLFVDNDLNIRCSTKSFYIEFEKSEKRYVETDCIISIEIEQPKPKFYPNTLQLFDKVLVRNEKSSAWRARFFEVYKDGVYYMTSEGCWKYCIPYNDETKHLHGTHDEAPEFYKLD